MNYKKCKPTTRFEIGQIVLPDDFDKKYSRTIVSVLKKGYLYTDNISEGIKDSSKCNYDPYMIWWGVIGKI